MYFIFSSFSLSLSPAPSPPLSPVNTTAVNIRYNSATIRWIVPSISYTPEEYVVLYGTVSTNMNTLSSVINGSTNFSITNSLLTVDLFDLTHDTVYYFSIRSTNTEGSTESGANSFKTGKRRNVICINAVSMLHMLVVLI